MMEVVYRNENLFPKEKRDPGRKTSAKLKSVMKLAGKPRKKYPMLYMGVGDERVKRILKKVFSKRKKNDKPMIN